jgi:hypothetical protein
MVESVMKARRLAFVLALPMAAAISSALGCSGPSGNELFAQNGISNSASVNAGSSSGASAGTDSGPNQSESGGSTALGGSTGIAGNAASGSGGSEQGLVQSGGSSGSGGQPQTPPVIESCDMLDSAVTNEENGHCYRVSTEELTYAAARAMCEAAGGHLLTVATSEENDFVHDLHDGEHWLGADDGRADSEPGVGDYTWVDQEEWTFSDWRGGQPNAVETDCPGHSGGGGCYEHCAYQTEEGDWVDRSCGHTIVSICEWEPRTP